MAQTQQKTECSFIPIVINKYTDRVYTWRNRVPRGALERLELLDAKVSRAVLRGRDGGNTVLLLDTLATCSDGRTFDNPKALRKKINALKRASRQHSRKKKGSQNRRRAQRKLAKMHARIANVRKDALHKATSQIVAKTKPDCERPSVIVLEDLHVSGMLKNRRLARAIADVGLYEFRRQIEYKAASAGVAVQTVSRWFPSSKTCSGCGTVKEELLLSERTFVCEACGLTIDRDFNAARVLAASV